MRIATTPSTATRLEVPARLRAQLDTAVRSGIADAAEWARLNPTAKASVLDAETLRAFPPPPSGMAAMQDMQGVKAAQALRTPEGTERTRLLAKEGGRQAWQGVIEEIRETEGVAQAHRAARLLEASALRTDEVSEQAKERFGRLRPYQVDPSVDPIAAKPNGNASYPSGHASDAYAAALVLGALVPHRAADLRALADEIAYSRVYGGVHFPSDVVMGARFAARIAADVLRRDRAGLPLELPVAS